MRNESIVPRIWGDVMDFELTHSETKATGQEIRTVLIDWRTWSRRKKREYCPFQGAHVICKDLFPELVSAMNHSDIQRCPCSLISPWVAERRVCFYLKLSDGALESIFSRASCIAFRDAFIFTMHNYNIRRGLDNIFGTL